MSDLNTLQPKEVFDYFTALAEIPHGSGNMTAVADFCMNFAKEHSLRALRDKSDNVIIFKPATSGFEDAAPIILQGHLDMVCQKTEDSEIDFLRDGLKLYVDGDFLKARGTTLGADNGIAVAMVLAILASDSIAHPAIEAVFTTDEEVGMLGALALDTSPLTAKRMINLDSENMDCMTVSCAGGSDFAARIPVSRVKRSGEGLKIKLSGLLGGHSGVCIHEGRVNANILGGRLLNYLNLNADFELVSVSGGDKGNAIPNCCEIVICTDRGQALCDKINEYLKIVKQELSAREPQLSFEVTELGSSEYDVLSADDKTAVVFALCCALNGVRDMSKEIDGLVETSLNLGILETRDDEIYMLFALRSNKKTAMQALEDTLKAHFSMINASFEVGGHYPPWEFNPNSTLQRVYIDCYREHFGAEPRVEAIHAGLECGVFADKIADFDCIAIGPQMYDVHTTSERLSISSTAEIYKLLTEILAKCR